MSCMLVALDTAWGTRFGGINAFNTELIKSLGVQPERDFKVCCIYPKVEAAEASEASKHYSVKLLGLGYSGDSFEDAVVADIRTTLGAVDFNNILWLGHDDKTGPLALQLRDALGGKAALIHHMAHGAYQGFKKGSSAEAEAKQEAQRLLFREADFCLAVGPRLAGELKQLLSTDTKRPPVSMLVPGLDDPADYDIACLDKPPEYFTGFAAGRLGAEDDRIKQGRLALRSFAEAVKKAEKDGRPAALRNAPRMCLMGADQNQETRLRQDLEAWGESQQQVSLLPFTQDRAAYYRKLAGSTFAMMLSWHEGFGLTGWEAIAARVPLILGKNSGLYALLRDEFQCQGEGHCIHPLAIAGHLPKEEGEENHRPEDVKAVVDAIHRLADDPSDAKKAAIRLRDMIVREGWSWERTARDFMEATGLPKRSLASIEQSPQASAETPQTDISKPEWLRVPAKPGWQADWGLSPAVLLQAAAAVVPFDPARQPLLDEVIAWAKTQDFPIKLRTFTGPGGTGKTRLALEAAGKLEAQGWQIHWLATDKPEHWLQEWKATLASEKPSLLVLDYAETRGTELRAMLEAAQSLLTSGCKRPLRVVLLARESGEWWKDLQREGPAAYLLNGPATIRPQMILPLAPEGDSREASFRAAVKAFSAVMGRAEPTGCYLPPLEQSLFGHPLYIHLAALAALEGQRPASAHALLEEQINREWRYWKHGPGTDLPYADWADALALLALTGGARSTAACAAWLQELGLAKAPELSEALAERYPGHPGIAPLQPDLLAEWLLRQCLGEDRRLSIASLALKYAPDSTVTVLGRLCAFDNPRPRIVDETLVSSLASGWPALGQKLIEVAHASAPGLGQLLAQSWQHMLEDQQAQLAANLECPDYSICLIELQVAICRTRLAQAGTSEADRAGALNALANRLSAQCDAKSCTEAIECAREAEGVYRELAKSQPTAYRHDWAHALNNLACCLSKHGDAQSRKEAVKCSRRSVEVYRELAKTEPTIHRSHLGGVLNNLASLLSKQGDPRSLEEAVECSREAVKVYRELAKDQPAAHRPHLAGFLNNLANRLFEQGDPTRLTEALEYSLEAVKVYRELAEAEPAAYRHLLAGFLNNLANLLSKMDDAKSHMQALECAREAEGIYRELAKVEPTAYRPDWALALNSLANCLSKQGNASSRDDAIKCIREAVDIRRKLAETQPAAYLPDLAMSLNNLGAHLSDQGDAKSLKEALDCAQEAVGHYASLHRSIPTAFDRYLDKACGTFLYIAEEAGLDAQVELRAVLESAGLKLGDK